MLRIDIVSDSAAGLVVALTGRIRGTHLPDIARLIDTAVASGRPIVFDFQGVRLIDREALRFLLSDKGRRARLLRCAPYIAEWLRREARELRRLP